MRQSRLRLALAAILALILGAAAGVIIAQKEPAVISSPNVVTVSEDQTIIGVGAVAADSESEPYEKRLSQFRWNTKNGKKDAWPTVLFRNEMNKTARAFVANYFSPKNVNNAYLSMVSGYNAKDTLIDFAPAFKHANISKVTLKKFDYSNGRYTVKFGGTSKGPQISFVVSMQGMQPNKWAISSFHIRQE